MKVLLANPGVQHAFHLARELHRRGCLARFHTGLAFGEDAAVLGLAPILLPSRALKAVRNRIVRGVPASRVRSALAIELLALLALRRGARAADVFRRRNAAFQMRIPDAGILACDAVIGTDTASEILARRARRLGRPFLLSRSIGEGRSWNRVATKLRSDWPRWADALDDKPPRDLRAEDREHSGSRLIVAPSRFVARTLIEGGVPSDRIRVNPFGCEVPAASGLRDSTAGPVVFLFAGAISARKGVPVLLDAWRRLGARNAELWLAGPGRPPAGSAQGLESVRWLGGLSRDALARVYGQADAFVFPSLFEGFAKVLGEAAAAGLPLIATRASGAEEILEEGSNGFFVQEGCADSLCLAMRRFLDRSDLAAAMGAESRSRAARLTWEAYGDRWVGILEEAVGRDEG